VLATRLVAGGDRRLAPAGPSGRPKTGPSPVDRARPDSKHHVITDGHGTPLAITLTGGNRHDITQLPPLLDAATGSGAHGAAHATAPRQLFADRGHDFDKYRRRLRRRGIKPVITRRGVPHGSGLGTVRWDIRDDFHEAFLKLACCVITYRRVQALCQLL